jgi:branched-chain amino acid transport system ATP-binding protein
LAHTDGGPILELKSITKRFHGLAAVNNVSAAIAPGEICGLIGPNGAGKSTLLSVMSGSLAPTSGEVFFLGENVTQMPLHRRASLGLARTFQLAHTFETMTVEENVLIGAEEHRHIDVVGALMRRNQAEISAREAAARAMAATGVSDLALVPAAQLTFGQQRMVATARALAANPRLLLLDEPAAGLSSKDVDLLVKAIRTVRANGTTVILVEHNMDLVMQLCERIVVLHLGEKIGDGLPREVKESARVLEAYLGV